MTATLEINGLEYGGWKSIRIELNMDTLSGGFNFGVTERWADGARDINKGDACKVRVEGQTVITGFVDAVEPEIGADGGEAYHSINIRGRDKAGDLVDCSAINSPGQWSGVNMGVIVKALTKPFNIPVAINTNVGKAFKKFNIQQGETVHEAIARLADMRGVLCYSDGHGGIIIANRATTRSADPLVMIDASNANNVKRARLLDTNEQRFSQYIVKGQQQGSDTVDPLSSSGSKGVVYDTEIRHRPLLLMAEGQASSRQCKEQAQWQKNTRKGASKEISATVQGWKQSNGQLWAINTIAPVRMPTLKIQMDMLIKSVIFTLDETGGTTTELLLTLPEAYDRIERPEE